MAMMSFGWETGCNSNTRRMWTWYVGGRTAQQRRANRRRKMQRARRAFNRSASRYWPDWTRTIGSYRPTNYAEVRNGALRIVLGDVVVASKALEGVPDGPASLVLQKSGEEYVAYAFRSGSDDYELSFTGSSSQAAYEQLQRETTAYLGL